MTDIHPSEQHFWLTTHRDSVVSSVLCLLAAWGLVAVSGLIHRPALKTAALGAGLVVTVAGKRSRRVVRSSEGILQDVEDISDQSRQNRLYDAFKPSQPALVTIASDSGQMELFDWNQLKNSPDRFPHILIEGSTGTGKTTLAEFVLELLPGERLIITPKRKVSQWRGQNVIGAPLRFPAIHGAFDTLLEEMKNRYELMNQGIEDYPTLNFVVDEYPLISANCDGISDTMMMLVRAAREAGMRMILIAQGSEGKALDIEGQTSVRDCFSRVRLGKPAVEHAKKLKRPNLVNWLEQQSRPCMVDDLPALVPDLTGFQLTPMPVEDSFPVLKSAQNGTPENQTTDQRVKELLKQGKSKTEIIWEVWQVKPNRGKAYTLAKQEYERILKSL